MLKVLELFAGIGAPIQALKNLNLDVQTVAISEIDKFAIEAYKHLHGEVLNLGDITKIDMKAIPDCDLMVYGFPCQDISVAGAQAGLNEGSETRSSLLWYCEEIVKEKRPKYLVMENVKNLVGNTHIANFKKWLQRLEGYGYNNYWKVLNANHFGIPQNRERVFCVSIYGEHTPFTFDEGEQTTRTIEDILEPESTIPENMYMNFPYIPRENASCGDSGLIQVGDLDMKGNEAIRRVYSPKGLCPTLTTMTGGHRQPKILTEDGRVRKLTPRECWRLMGFTDEQFDKVKYQSNAQLYKQAGNTICVPCLESIFARMFKA